VTNVLQSPLGKPAFCSEFAAMATRALGLKILVSVVRFRPWALFRVSGRIVFPAALSAMSWARRCSDQLKGISGRMEIQVVDGKHLYEFDYELGS